MDNIFAKMHRGLGVPVKASAKKIQSYHSMSMLAATGAFQRTIVTGRRTVKTHMICIIHIKESFKG